MENVFEALDWLKTNNRLYKDVIINRYLSKHQSELLFTETSEIESPRNNITVTKEKLEAYLQHTREEPLSHYTVIDIGKTNENVDDIEKFKMKKIQSIPITDRETNMDHLCFVDIFPKGRGGMYDMRPSTVIQPAMYLRWILHQSNASARRNTQYLFSAVNNKDVRAIDSGIFSTVRTSNIPNLTAKALINNVEQNAKQLETNLFNTMSAVRGTNEYWTGVTGDLKAFDQNFGPASWFITISTAEYDWDRLKEYLILKVK